MYPTLRKNKYMSNIQFNSTKRQHFGHDRIESICRRQFQIDENGRNLSKPVENTVFSKELVMQTCKNQGLFGKGLISANSLNLYKTENVSSGKGKEDYLLIVT